MAGASSEMVNLAEYVSGLISVERIGGRVQRMGVSRLVVHDCMHWAQASTDSIHALFPEVTIDISASRQSLSGFTVTLDWHGGGRVDVLLFGVIAAGVASCVYILLSSPWWGAYRWAHLI
jgi:hypothetical protein